MSSLSPAASLLWAILSTLLLGFLLNHLYQFDRFQCLRWNAPSQQHNGVLKRLLTSSYILSIPLLVIFSVTLASLKYSYGYVQILDGQIIPTPSTLWSNESRDALKALYIVFSVAWAIEMVSQLEELNFWLYLLTSTPKSRPWLSSLYFIVWCLGSGVVLLGMPVIAGFSNDSNIEANVFMSGSAGSLLITLVSLRVVSLFPKFLRKVRDERAEPEVIYRLTHFNELNNVRIFFRFLFIIPLLVLAIDGLATDNVYLPHVTRSAFWRDFLAMLAGVGIVVSSSITLMVFFPRTSAAEIAASAFRKSTDLGTGRPYRSQGIAGHYQFPARQLRGDLDATQPRSIDYPPRALHKRFSSASMSFDFSDPARTLDVSAKEDTHGYDRKSLIYEKREPFPSTPFHSGWLTGVSEKKYSPTSPIARMMAHIKNNNRPARTPPSPQHGSPPVLPAIHSPGHQFDVDPLRWAATPVQPKPDLTSITEGIMRHHAGSDATYQKSEKPASLIIPDVRVSTSSTLEGAPTSVSLYNDTRSFQGSRHTHGASAPTGLRPRSPFVLHTNASTETFHADPPVGVIIKQHAVRTRRPTMPPAPPIMKPLPDIPQKPDQADKDEYNPFTRSLLLLPANISSVSLQHPSPRGGVPSRELFYPSSSAAASKESLFSASSYQTERGQPAGMALARTVSSRSVNDDSSWVQNVPYEAMRLTGLRYAETIGTATPSVASPMPLNTPPPRLRVRTDSVVSTQPIVTNQQLAPKSHQGHVGMSGAASNPVSPA